MSGRVDVSILEARDLPVMDRASELTDAFVEVNNSVKSNLVFMVGIE